MVKSPKKACVPTINEGNHEIFFKEQNNTLGSGAFLGSFRDKESARKALKRPLFFFFFLFSFFFFFFFFFFIFFFLFSFFFFFCFFCPVAASSPARQEARAYFVRRLADTRRSDEAISPQMVLEGRKNLM